MRGKFDRERKHIHTLEIHVLNFLLLKDVDVDLQEVLGEMQLQAFPLTCRTKRKEENKTKYYKSKRLWIPNSREKSQKTFRYTQ